MELVHIFFWLAHLKSIELEEKRSFGQKQQEIQFPKYVELRYILTAFVRREEVFCYIFKLLASRNLNNVFSLLLFCTIFHQTYIVNIKSKNAISAETGTVQTSYSFTFYIMELQRSQKCTYQQKCLYCDINTEVRSRIHVTIVN